MPRSPAMCWRWSFEKEPRARTRVSFDMAIRQLGGTSIVMDAGSMQLGRGESIADTARILSGYVDAIMIRTDDHQKVVDMAKRASVPVINDLTDASHPARSWPTWRRSSRPASRCRGSRSPPGWATATTSSPSIMEAGGLMGFDVVAACPQDYRPSDADVGRGKGRAKVVGPPAGSGGRRRHRRRRHLDLDGRRRMRETKLAAMIPFQVTEALMGVAEAGRAGSSTACPRIAARKWSTP